MDFQVHKFSKSFYTGQIGSPNATFLHLEILLYHRLHRLRTIIDHIISSKE